DGVDVVGRDRHAGADGMPVGAVPSGDLWCGDAAGGHEGADDVEAGAGAEAVVPDGHVEDALGAASGARAEGGPGVAVPFGDLVGGDAAGGGEGAADVQGGAAAQAIVPDDGGLDVGSARAGGVRATADVVPLPDAGLGGGEGCGRGGGERGACGASE